MTRSRIAPTPSGFLHAGNGVNFVLTWLVTRSEKGLLRLRIDDLDAPRIDREYIEDVFRTLEWLDIDWDEGPSGPDEHSRLYSQRFRIPRYNELIGQFKERDVLFMCKCSRKEIQEQSKDGQYPGTCRGKDLLIDADTAIRFMIPSPCVVRVNDMRAGTIEIDLYKRMRDPVIRRRDGIPAYHIASIADDIDYGIDLVVRGADLLDSTAVQLYIADAPGTGRFSSTRFYHHPLIHSEDGKKLSKSAGSSSLKSWRERGSKPEAFYLMMSSMLGLTEKASSARELLQLFEAGKIILPEYRSEIGTSS